jgi:hypothetical protein
VVHFSAIDMRCGHTFANQILPNQNTLFSDPSLTPSSFHLTINRSLPKLDLRIEIFVLKLVYTENFMTFGHSWRELSRFENFICPKHLEFAAGTLPCQKSFICPWNTSHHTRV